MTNHPNRSKQAKFAVCKIICEGMFGVLERHRTLEAAIKACTARRATYKGAPFRIFAAGLDATGNIDRASIQ